MKHKLVSSLALSLFLAIGCGTQKPNVVEICDNVTDDDGNGFVDCGDIACSGDPACELVELCDNNTDDDNDGAIDCADGDCAFSANCQLCGNGNIDTGEFCDGSNLDGQSCTSLGFAGGTLGCNSDCQGFDTNGCDNGGGGNLFCGNGNRDVGETCDGADFGGQTCITLGFTGGTLACNVDCQGFDTNGCTGGGDPSPENCSNGIDDDGDLVVDCADTDCAAVCGDACSAPQSVNPNGNITSSNAGRTDSRQSCVQGPGNDIAFSVTPAVSGALNITLSSAVDLGMFVRTTCNSFQTEIACTDQQGAGTDETLTVPATAGEPLFVIVDGFQGAQGDFTLTFSNSNQPIDCGASSNAVVGTQNGDTTGANAVNNTAGSCVQGGQNTNEQRFVFTPSQTGNLTITMNSSKDQALFVRTDCASPASELDCTDQGGPNQPETLTVPVQQGQPISIYVEAFQSNQNAGAFTLILQ